MQELLDKLKALHKGKMESRWKVLQNAREQLKLLDALEGQEKQESRIIAHVLENIAREERYKEFNISLAEFNKIVREKSVVQNLSFSFRENLKEFTQLLAQLKAIISAQQLGHDVSELLDEEMKLYASLQECLNRILSNDTVIKQYFADIRKLTYSRKWIRSGQVISRLLSKTRVTLYIEGIENIPQRGPCILAPHHYHAALDPLLLNSLIDRPLFYLTSVETFVSFSVFDKILYRLGCLPEKREDARFPQRLASAIPAEKIKEYGSSDLETLRKALTHLKYGDALVIFPEGDSKIMPTYQRQNNEDFLNPQSGFVSIACLAERKFKVRIPILPIGISYKEGFLKAVKVRIGSALYLDASIQEMSREQLREAIEKATSRIFEVIKSLSS
jgi:1-acyl-sn-glycerol-3-phosphate acyltransferase